MFLHIPKLSAVQVKSVWFIWIYAGIVVGNKTRLLAWSTRDIIHNFITDFNSSIIARLPKKPRGQQAASKETKY